MKVKQIFSLAVVAIVIALFATSCNFSYPGFKKTESGAYYKIHTKNNQDTARIRMGSIVTIDLNYGIKDSILFDSKTSTRPLIMQIPESQYAGDIYECLMLFNQGDSATFILKAGPLFTKTFQQPELPEFLKEDDDIYFNVKIQKVQSQEQIDRETEIKNMELEKEETIKIQDYIRSNNITVVPSSTGIYYLETLKGKGKSPIEEGYLTAHYTVSLLGGEKLFSTKDRGEPVDFKYKSQFENVGFHEVIGLMREGGKANAIVPSAMAFGKQGAGSIVPPFATLYYDIELIKVITKEEFDAKQAKKAEQKKAENSEREKNEADNIQKYLKDNAINPTVILPSGLIYVEKQAGNGPKPANGKKVKVHYTGMLLDGTKFDSSVDRGEPFEFVIGQKQVIDGWDQGIALMNQGAKGMLIIPSKLGYKDRGAGNGEIPPFATLMFEVELIEVEK
jgi:FKBP-type peptidyl-prolyl cis-trans isomerase